MEIALVFGGIVVSLLVEAVKTKWRLNAFGIMVFVAVLSLLGGLAYQAMLHYGLWEAFIGVVASAGAFYAFIIKNVKDASASIDREDI